MSNSYVYEVLSEELDTVSKWLIRGNRNFPHLENVIWC